MRIDVGDLTAPRHLERQRVHMEAEPTLAARGACALEYCIGISITAFRDPLHGEIQLIGIGVVGEYIGRIYEESKSQSVGSIVVVKIQK